MKLIHKLCAVALALSTASAIASPTYEFVGSWFVDNGPLWYASDVNGNYTTPVLSGVEAAAFIFGGSAADYAISTVDSNVANINFKAWMDGWGDTLYASIPAAQDLHIDINNDGLYAAPGGQSSAFSAYVMDHSVHLQNFAFKVVQNGEVPEPATVALLGLGLLCFAASRRKATKSKNA